MVPGSDILINIENLVLWDSSEQIGWTVNERHGVME